jgi:hypothetical protein
MSLFLKRRFRCYSTSARISDAYPFHQLDRIFHNGFAIPSRILIGTLFDKPLNSPSKTGFKNGYLTRKKTAMPGFSH